MAAFEYKALDAKGKTVKGVIEAETARAARQSLREKALVPVSIEETKAKEKRVQSSGLNFQRGISTNELSLLTRQLSTLVTATMPLEECLKAVAEQTEKPRLKNMLTSVRSRVVEGYTLSDSLADYPYVFDQLFRAMVAAGEKSGHLGPVLERLADYVENRQAIKSKLTQAMVYPAVLTVAAVAIVSFLLATVVPDIVGQFISTGAELPGMTKVLLAASDFVTNWGWLVITSEATFIPSSKGIALEVQIANVRANREVFNPRATFPTIGILNIFRSQARRYFSFFNIVLKITMLSAITVTTSQPQ